MDLEEYLDATHLPDDAGEYADGLLRVLNRIPPRWGRWISCDKGWHPLIIELDQRLAEIVPDYQVYQVKEKFGALHYYIDLPDHNLGPRQNLLDAARDIINEYEELSVTTCEVCGESGKTRVRNHWYKTLCDPCANTLGYDAELDYNDGGH